MRIRSINPVSERAKGSFHNYNAQYIPLNNAAERALCFEWELEPCRGLYLNIGTIMPLDLLKSRKKQKKIESARI
jgi:hypothetical protein